MGAWSWAKTGELAKGSAQELRILVGAVRRSVLRLRRLPTVLAGFLAKASPSV